MEERGFRSSRERGSVFVFWKSEVLTGYASLNLVSGHDLPVVVDSLPIVTM